MRELVGGRHRKLRGFEEIGTNLGKNGSLRVMDADGDVGAVESTSGAEAIVDSDACDADADADADVDA